MTNAGRMSVCASRDLMARLLAAELADRIEDAVDQRGEAGFVAAGGRTPVAAYQRLAAMPISWDRVRVTPSDECWTSRCWPDSNELMLRAILMRGPAASAALVPMKSGTETLAQSAGRVDRLLQSLKRPADVVLLGMGEDGRIASLFPGSAALDQALEPGGDRFCVVVPAGPAGPSQPRISLTLRVVASARRVILAITGSAKRQMFERALDGDDANELPVRAVIRHARSLGVIWAP